MKRHLVLASLTFFIWNSGCTVNTIDIQKTSSPDSPGQPVLSIADSEISVSWTRVSGADTYDVHYHTENNFSESGKSGSGITENTHSITVSNGSIFYVWIVAANSAGNSDPGPSANTAPGTPAPSLDVIDSYKLNVSWSSVERATSYDVRYHTTDSFGAASQSVSGTTETSHSINIQDDGTYYIWVVAKSIQNVDNESLPVSSNITVYKVGDTGPGGGVIFYDDTIGVDFGSGVQMNLFPGTSLDGKRFLEAAPGDLSSRWGLGGNISTIDTIPAPFSPSDYTSDMGKGLYNTNEIVSYYSGITTDTAAQKAYDYTNNDTTDWFLPSFGELRTMYIRRSDIGVFQNAYYWSSSENDSSGLRITFVNGSTSSAGKSNDSPVRPVRAF